MRSIFARFYQFQCTHLAKKKIFLYFHIYIYVYINVFLFSNINEHLFRSFISLCILHFVFCLIVISNLYFVSCILYFVFCCLLLLLLLLNRLNCCFLALICLLVCYLTMLTKYIYTCISIYISIVCVCVSVYLCVCLSFSFNLACDFRIYSLILKCHLPPV